MKKHLVLIFFLLASLSTIAGELTPLTTIKVKIKVRKEQIRMGKYARYAQQFMGISGAPLNDKDIYSIEGVSLETLNFTNRPYSAGSVEAYNRESDGLISENRVINEESSFSSVWVNSAVMSFPTSKSDVELARDVAQKIFNIRQRRFDMVTGETIDLHAGVGASIDEMNRLEKEYLKLFVGASNVTYETYIFNVTPSKDRTKYIVCRVAENKGVLPSSDITGEAMLLNLKSMNTLRPQIDGKPKKGYVPVLHPETVECSLYLGTEKLASNKFEIFQFGNKL